MSAERTVLVAEAPDAPGVHVLTLNRPSSANALNPTLVRELLATLRELADRDDWDVLVVTGAGRHFCGGADLKDRDHSPRWFREVRACMDDLSELPRPTIAAINGAAMGGGCELAMSCDLRVIGEDCPIGVPEIKIGALAVAGGTQRLPRLVGPAKALELLYTGEPVDAAEAHRIGLVNRVVPAGTALASAIELGRLIGSRNRPSLELAKSLTRVATETAIAEGLAIEATASAALVSGLSATIAEAAERDPKYRQVLS